MFLSLDWLIFGFCFFGLKVSDYLLCEFLLNHSLWEWEYLPLGRSVMSRDFCTISFGGSPWSYNESRPGVPLSVLQVCKTAPHSEEWPIPKRQWCSDRETATEARLVVLVFFLFHFSFYGDLLHSQIVKMMFIFQICHFILAKERAFCFQMKWILRPQSHLLLPHCCHLTRKCYHFLLISKWVILRHLALISLEQMCFATTKVFQFSGLCTNVIVPSVRVNYAVSTDLQGVGQRLPTIV